MTFFTTLETVSSVFSAAIFGAIFAFFDTILKILSVELNHIKKIKEHLFSNKRLFEIPKRSNALKDGKIEKSKIFGEVATFLKILLFTLGFILLSYYALDGAVRIYLLLFAVGFFLLFKYASDVSLFRLADSFFVFIYGILIIFLRLISRPIMATSKKVKKSLTKNKE